MQELEFLHSVDDSDDELPMPLAHRSFLQNIYDAFVIAIQRCVCTCACATAPPARRSSAETGAHKVAPRRA
jgi:hypothetical protein